VLLGVYLDSRRSVSPRQRSGEYAPKEFANHPDSGGYTVEDFRLSMERLLKAKAITVEKDNRKSFLMLDSER